MSQKLRMRWPYRWLCSLLIACLLGVASAARAQVALNALHPAPLTSDGFALGRAQVLERGRYQVQALVDYANDPLVLRLSRAHSHFSVVHNQLVVHVGGAFGVSRRITLFGSLPVHAWMAGTDPAPYASKADGPGLADLMLGGRALLLGAPGARGMLSAELMLRAPTAELANGSQRYAGDVIGSYEPALIGELSLGRLDLRARAGARFRKASRVVDLTLGQELLYGLGARVRVVDQLYAHAELYGSSFLGHGAQPELSPLELLFGLKTQLADWNLGAAAGPGLMRGYGAPDFRMLGSFAYAPARKAEPAPRDRDHDGLPDARDLCPADAEDHDGVEDGDGCPELDVERDPVVDRDSAYPADPGQHAIGALTAGCPDPDRDVDGVLDGDDQCADALGPAENHGCPGLLVDAETQQLVVPSGIEFALNGDQILAQSLPVLDQILTTMQNNPQLARIRIEGHTDDSGVPLKNLELSKRRAASVAHWFLQHGIEAARLQAWGCGKTRPLAPNDSDVHRQQNRRVEFHVLGKDAAPARSDACVEMQLSAPAHP